MNSFTFSEKDVETIKNTAQFSQGLLFRPGNILKAKSPLTTVVMKAELETNIPAQFAIYDISKFLGALTLFGELPNMTVRDNHLLLQDDCSEIEYRTTDEMNIKSPGDNEPQDDFIIEPLMMPKVQVKNLLRAAAALNLTHLQIALNPMGSFIAVCNPTNSGADIYKNSWDSAQVDCTANMLIKIENLPLRLDSDYKVGIDVNGRYVAFVGDAHRYWVGVEADGSSIS